MPLRKRAALNRENFKDLKKGVELAADIADQYNSLSLHDFRLGDYIKGKLNFGRLKPRKNLKTPATYAACQRILLELKVTDKMVLAAAFAIAPEAWAHYVSQKGRIGPSAGRMCVESVKAAKRLLADGFRDCAPASGRAA